MLVLLLNRPDLAGDITRNETYNLQNHYGGLEPVLETRYNEEEMGWAGDWIGRLWQWMSANDIFIHGGTRLDLACIGGPLSHRYSTRKVKQMHPSRIYVLRPDKPSPDHST